MHHDREVNRLLKEHKCQLVRNKKHEVWKLPNGHTWVRSSTPSDTDRAHIDLATLKRALGLRKKESTMTTMMDAMESAGLSQPSRLEDPLPQEVAPEPPPAPQEPSKSPMRQRLDAQFAELEDRKKELQVELDTVTARLGAEIAGIDTDMENLLNLMVVLENPAMERTLSMLVTGPAPHRQKVPAPGQESKMRPCEICGRMVHNKGYHPHLTHCRKLHGDHPTFIRSGLEVSEQRVLAATQTFSQPFTTADVIALMVGKESLTKSEEVRIKQEVAKRLGALKKVGHVIESQRAWARRPAIWRRVDMTRISRA